MEELTRSGSSASLPPASAVDGPCWDDDLEAERKLHSCFDFRRFKCLLDHRAELWNAETRWLQDVASKAEEDHGRLINRRRDVKKQLQRESEIGEAMQRKIDEKSDVQELARLHEEAVAERDAAQRHAQDFLDEEVQVGKEEKDAEEQLKQQEEVARQAEEDYQAARKEADQLEEDGARERVRLEKHCSEVQENARMQLHGWKTLEMQNMRLELLQQEVTACMADEADGRAQLQAEAREMLRELRLLSQQLHFDLEEDRTQLQVPASSSSSTSAGAKPVQGVHSSGSR